MFGSGTLTATWSGGTAPYTATATQGTNIFNDEEVDKADASISIDLANPNLTAGALTWTITDSKGATLTGTTNLTVSRRAVK